MTDLFKNAIFSRTILIVLLLFNSPVVYSANPIIQNMIATFEANEAKFYQQYRGRKIEGEGTVTAIESVLYGRAIGFSISLNTDGSSVRCLTQNQNTAARLNKGQKVNFIGIVDDVLINQLSIESCVVSDMLKNTNLKSNKPSPSYKIPSFQLDFENTFKKQSEKAIEVINSRTNKDTKREDFKKSQIFNEIKNEIILKTKNYINGSRELSCKIISFNSFKMGDIDCRSLITDIVYKLKVSNFDKELKISESLLFEDDIININVELYDFSLNANYPINQIRLEIKGESSNKITLLNDNNKKIVIPTKLQNNDSHPRDTQEDIKKLQQSLLNENLTDNKNITKSQNDAVDKIKNNFFQDIYKEIISHKKYPKIAAMRNWQGDVTLGLVFNNIGQLTTIKTIQSSGYEVLDRQAQDMVNRALPFRTLPPKVLQDEDGNTVINITIPFRLVSDSEVNNGIIDEFQAKIVSKIRSNINNTLCERSDAEVTFEIKLTPTGEFSEGPILISSNSNGNCNNAIEHAIRMSEPLPLPQDKSLFKNFEKLRLKLQPNQ